MAEAIVQDWLVDFERLQSKPDESATFILEHDTDSDVAEAIFTIFIDRLRYSVLIHDICQQLLAFYRSSNKVLQKFPMQFLPVLIYTYLHAVASGDKKGVRSLETLLICIYNGEVSTADGGYKVVQFRMPVLAQASVYHEEKNLPMTDLRRWEENCRKEIKWGPHSLIEAINARNRLKIMTALMFCYNQQVSQTQKSALIHLCRVASQLVNEGFVNRTSYGHKISYGSDQSLMPKAMLARIPLSSAFLVELVHAIYFAMFNGFGTVAIQTLEDIHNRGCFELYAEVILVTSAVRNSLHANPSGQPCDGPMGLSIALTPSTATVTTSISKSMITNASFRTKKLPDDIPIQVQDLTMSQAHQPLTSVLEETAEQTQNTKEQKESCRNSLIRPSMEGIKAHAHKALIAGFKKSKDKEKDKDKETNKCQLANNIGNNLTEVPKLPQKKFDKHTQRNSLMQLQLEGMATADYEKTTVPVKIKTYESMDTVEMLSMTALLPPETGSGTFSVDSDLNGSNTLLSNASLANSNNNSTTTTISIASSDLLTAKSFESAGIDMSPLNMVVKKATDPAIVD